MCDLYGRLLLRDTSRKMSILGDTRLPRVCVEWEVRMVSRRQLEAEILELAVNPTAITKTMGIPSSFTISPDRQSTYALKKFKTRSKKSGKEITLGLNPIQVLWSCRGNDCEYVPPSEGNDDKIRCGMCH